MLRRVEQLIAEDIRVFSGSHEFNFEKDITLVHGDNGKGKSTLGTLVMLTLLYPAKSSKLKEQLLPKRGGSPKSSVTFRTDDGRFTISKVWGDKNQTKLLNAESGELIAEGSAAVEMAGDLAYGIDPKARNYSTKIGPSQNLRELSEAELPSLAFHLQGELYNSLKMGEHLRRIGLEVDEAILSKALHKVEVGAEKEAKDFISTLKADGTPTKKADGKVITLQSEKVELEQAISDGKNLESELINAESKLIEKRDLDSEISEDSREEKRREIRSMREAVEEHRSQRDAAHELYETQRSSFEPIQISSNKRTELLNHNRALVESIENEKAELTIKEAKLTEANQVFIEADENVKNHLTELQVAKDWVAFEGSQEQANRNHEQLENLKQQRDLRITKEAEIVDWKAEIDGIQTATDEQFERLRGLDERIVLATSNRAMDISILKVESDTTVLGDGLEIQGDGSASEKIEIVRKGDVIIQIDQAMSGELPSNLESEKVEILRSLGVESRSELIVRRDRKQELKVNIAATANVLSGMPEISSLDAQITDLQIESRKETPTPETPRPEGNLDDLVVRIEERVKLSEEQRETLRDSKDEAKTGQEVASEQLKITQNAHLTSENELNEHRLEHGADDVLSESHATQEKVLMKKKELYEEFVKHKPLREDAPSERANLLQDSLDDYDSERASILQLEERVIQLRNNPILVELPDLEANLIILDDKLEKARFDHAAYRLLSELGRRLKVDAQTQSRSEIKDRMDRLLGYIWGSPTSIHFDENGSPVSAEQIDVMDESHGTKEQLQAVMRMVLLSVVSGGRGTPMILDDAFVFADPGRLNRMKDVIRTFTRDDNLQFIILSCDRNDFVDVADHQIELD